MKVCPRCSYVDTEGRRVCLACRGSLMGVQESDVAHVVAQRTTALAGVGAESPSVPWGPALRTILDDLEPVPDDVVAADAAAFDDDRLNHLDRLDRPDAGAPAPAAGPAAIVPPAVPTVPAVPAVPTDPEETRRRLSRLYDTRTAAPVLVEADAPRPAARPATETGPTRTATRRPATPRAMVDAGIEARNRTRRNAVALVVVLVIGFLGVRAVKHALAGDDAAAVRDPATAVDRLPWRDEQYGQLVVSVPTSPDPRAVDVASGYSRFDRYVLPDVTITITARAAVPGLSTDQALRTYAAQAAQLGGGGVANGFARDLTFGTAFSATLDVPDGLGYLYVVSTATEVVEIRADATDGASGRPTRVFEQIIRSVTPR